MSQTAKENRATATNRFQPTVDTNLDLSAADIQNGSKRFEAWHWGEPTLKVMDVNDPDMPRMLIECGRLIRLHVRAPRAGQAGHPRRVRDSMIEFSASVSNNAHLAFDPEHRDQRLYCVVPEGARKVLKERFWDENSAEPINLNQLAIAVGGRQARRPDYPNVTVRPIGICTAVVYRTTKKGDGNSFYIHRMAEISGHFPALAIDSRGRLWFAGGAYTAPAAGITD